MAKGKYKQSAIKRIEFAATSETIESLTKQVEELRAENEALRKQSDQDHQQHAFQIATIFEDMQQKSSPKVRDLEADNERLREEILKLKKALRGL